MESQRSACFMQAQIKRIEIDKWCEGCSTKRDPGKEFIFNWIKNYAREFRYKWEHSSCKSCQNAKDCGHLVKKDCKNFKPFS